MAKPDKVKKEKKEKKDKSTSKSKVEDSVEVKDVEEEAPKRKRGLEKLSELDKKNAAVVADAAEAEEAEGDNEEAGEGGGNEPARKRKRNRTRKKKTAQEDGDDNDEDKVPLKGALVEGTVYVEGISYDADDSDVVTFFEQVGKVSSIRMPRWHDSNKPRGYAHVVFEDEKHVQAAIKQLNNQRLMGRYLKVALPNVPKAAGGGPTTKAPEGCLTVFVKNIPYDCNEQAVRDVMAAFGVVKDVRLAVHNTSIGAPRLKGFGYVQFASEVSVNKACAAATAGTLKIGDRSLFLDFDAQAKPKGSFRRTDGTHWRETETR